MHKVFISHHHRNDQRYKEKLVEFGERHSVFVDRSVDTGDIPDDWADERIRREIRDRYLRDSTVTVVLVGRETKRRKHIDWEIHSSMYDGSVNHRSGIVVINLPGISDGQFTAAHGDKEKRLLYPDVTSWTHIEERAEYERRYPHMPDRIIDNLVKPDVRISVAPWERINEERLEFLIDAAFRCRKDCRYDLSRPMRRAGRPRSLRACPPHHQLHAAPPGRRTSGPRHPLPAPRRGARQRRRPCTDSRRRRHCAAARSMIRRKPEPAPRRIRAVNPHELMEAARALAESGHAPPTQARLRRAVSTAYYAMFHCLAASAADLFIGTERSPAWHRTYRALEHGRARSACLQGRIMREFPAEIRDFAEAFVALQKARQEADYALDTDTYQDSDVLGYIASAERAISRFEQADIAARRGFVAHALFRQRPS